MYVCVFVCVVVAGPAEARWASDSAGRASRREPDAGAVWQIGGWQYQNEATDGRDLRAFNRQRQAVVKVEVTSCPLSPLSSRAQVKRCGPEQTEAAFAACHLFCCSIPWWRATQIFFFTLTHQPDFGEKNNVLNFLFAINCWNGLEREVMKAWRHQNLFRLGIMALFTLAAQIRFLRQIRLKSS